MMDDHHSLVKQNSDTLRVVDILFVIAAIFILGQLIYHLGEYAGQITYYLSH
jgi:hypothetical protein